MVPGEDIQQELYLRMAQILERDPLVIENVKGYQIQGIHNTALLLKRGDRRNQTNLERLKYTAAPTKPNELDYAELRNAIQSLSPVQQRVVELMVGDAPVYEIGEILGEPASQRTNYNRGREAIEEIRRKLWGALNPTKRTSSPEPMTRQPIRSRRRKS